MRAYYIDTSALVWRYLNGTVSPQIDSILDSAVDRTFTNEITILEWSSSLGKTILRKHMKSGDFGPNERALFTDIAHQKLRIIRTERVIERARDLIRYLAAVKARQLRTMDAVHLASAIDLSIQLGSTVEFVTCDKKLAKAAALDFCKQHIVATYLQQGATVKAKRCRIIEAIWECLRGG